MSDSPNKLKLFKLVPRLTTRVLTSHGVYADMVQIVPGVDSFTLYFFQVPNGIESASDLSPGQWKQNPDGPDEVSAELEPVAKIIVSPETLREILDVGDEVCAHWEAFQGDESGCDPGEPAAPHEERR